MHRCLEILEILGRIAEYLTPKEASQFALTRRAFLGPGLDKVWLQIRSFEPLIACLPHGIWSEEKIIVPTTWPEYDDDEEYTMLVCVWLLPSRCSCS